MKRVLFLMFLLIVSVSVYHTCYAASYEELFNRIEKVSGVNADFRIVSNGSSSYSYLDVVVLDKLDIENTCPGNEYRCAAFVLGHEISHVKFGDTFRRPSREQEVRADKFGTKYMRALGYSCQDAVFYFKELLKTHGDISSEEHPPLTVRIKNILRECE